MIRKKVKYYLFFNIIINLSVTAQEPNDNQAIVTIVGNNVNDNAQEVNQNYQQFYQQIKTPPSQGKINNPNIIEPSLENGFHMRFELTPPPPKVSNGVYASAGSSNYEAKKHSHSIAERSFNLKKRLKAWLPKRKKKYRPNLCMPF